MTTFDLKSVNNKLKTVKKIFAVSFLLIIPLISSVLHLNTRDNAEEPELVENSESRFCEEKEGDDNGNSFELDNFLFITLKVRDELNQFPIFLVSTYSSFNLTSQLPLYILFVCLRIDC